MNDIGNLLGDQIGNILGIAGLVTGFIFYWLSRKPKRFGWHVISTTEIVSFKGRSLPLRVVYDGEEVYSPNIIVLRVGNAGKAEIKPDDYDGPVRVEFTKGRLLAFDVSEKLNDRISIQLTQDSPMSVTVVPSLLNGGEWVNLQFITDGPIETPKVSARIAGESSLAGDVVAQQKRVWRPWAMLGGVLFFVVPLFSWIALSEEDRGLGTASFLIGLILLWVAMVQGDKAPVWGRKPASKKSRPRKVSATR